MSSYMIFVVCLCIAAAAGTKDLPKESGAEIVQDLKSELRSEKHPGGLKDEAKLSEAKDVTAAHAAALGNILKAADQEEKSQEEAKSFEAKRAFLKNKQKINDTPSASVNNTEQASATPAGLAKLVEDSTQAQGGDVKAWPKEAEKKQASTEAVAPKANSSFWVGQEEQKAQDEKAKAAAKAAAEAADQAAANVNKTKAPVGSLKDLESKAVTVKNDEEQKAVSDKAVSFKKAQDDFNTAKAKINASRVSAFVKDTNSQAKTAENAQERWLAKWEKMHKKLPVRPKKDLYALLSKPKAAHKRTKSAKEIHEEKQFDQQARRCVAEGSSCWEAYNGCAEDFCHAFLTTIPRTECFQKALVAYHRLPQDQLAKACPGDHGKKEQ